MNLFRISVIILALVLIAGAVVHIRLQNSHYAYQINQLYDKNQRLQREYSQYRLELARYQSPDNLLDRLRELNLPLEGLAWTTTTAPAEKNIPKAGTATPKTKTKSSRTKKANSHD